MGVFRRHRPAPVYVARINDANDWHDGSQLAEEWKGGLNQLSVADLKESQRLFEERERSGYRTPDGYDGDEYKYKGGCVSNELFRRGVTGG